jgi:CrcB protein
VRQRLGWLGLILVGAMAGTSVRSALEAAWPAAPGGWPWTTFWINLSGSFILGALLEFLAASALDANWQRGLRLGLGTGLISGFTTYSTFAAETAALGTSGAILVSLGYALVSVTAGVLLAAAGMLLARRLVGGRR